VGYVNNVLKGKLLESEILVQQAMSNTKGQFANSPDLCYERRCLRSATTDVPGTFRAFVRTQPVSSRDGAEAR